MDKAIYKYKLKPHRTNHLAMPRGAQMLNFDFQYGTGWCVWALVDTDEQINEEVGIAVVPTGKLGNAFYKFKFIGTAVDNTGSGLVYHALLITG